MKTAIIIYVFVVFIGLYPRALAEETPYLLSVISVLIVRLTGYLCTKIEKEWGIKDI